MDRAPSKDDRVIPVAIIFFILPVLFFLAMHWFPTGCPSGRPRNTKGVAMNVLKQLSAGTLDYASTHNGQLPEADLEGDDTWATAMLPNADTVWYNAIPRLSNSKGVGDFAKEGPLFFYMRGSLFFVPGAQYPETKSVPRPYFAIAMNGLLRKRGPDGKLRMVKLSEIQKPSRTVLFFECGVPGEPRAHESQSKKNYDGAPAGHPSSFVARYSRRGLLVFVDGTCAEVSGKQLFNADGSIVWSPASASDPSAIFWTADPNQDPNGSRQ